MKESVRLSMYEKLVNKILYSIPECQAEPIEIIDADWHSEYGTAILLRTNNKSIVSINKVHTERFLSQHELSNIRWIDHKTLLAVSHEEQQEKHNIFIFNSSGGAVSSFYGGMGIEDIVVGGEGIWISYFDEGVFGSGISTEGLVLFDITGNVLFRYHTDLLNPPLIAECYALSKGADTTVWLFPYTDFPLIQLNPHAWNFQAYSIPGIVHGARAISVKENIAYFAHTYHSDQNVYHLDIDKNELSLVGRLTGKVRGLDPSKGHQFISVNSQEVVLCTVMDKMETYC